MEFQVWIRIEKVNRVPHVKVYFWRFFSVSHCLKLLSLHSSFIYQSICLSICPSQLLTVCVFCMFYLKPDHYINFAIWSFIFKKWLRRNVNYEY